jgi:hypothetical protein
MTRLRLPIIIECLLFFVPLNIYGIGNNLATGVQWALFRYQESYLGNSLILIHRDLGYVLDDTLRGSSAFSTVIWILGAFLLVAALILLMFATVQDDTRPVKPAGLLNIAGGVFFLVAMIVQYGPALHSDHGFSLPIGVPLVLVTGCWLAFWNFCDDENEAVDVGDAESHDSDSN